MPSFGARHAAGAQCNGLELGKPRRERPLQMKGLCVSGFSPLAPLCPQSLFRAEVHTWQWNWGQGHVYKAGPVLPRVGRDPQLQARMTHRCLASLSALGWGPTIGLPRLPELGSVFLAKNPTHPEALWCISFFLPANLPDEG